MYNYPESLEYLCMIFTCTLKLWESRHACENHFRSLKDHYGDYGVLTGTPAYTLAPLSPSACPPPLRSRGSVLSADSALLSSVKVFLKLFCNHSHHQIEEKRVDAAAPTGSGNRKRRGKHGYFDRSSEKFFVNSQFLLSMDVHQKALLCWRREGRKFNLHQWKFAAGAKGEHC